jgi:hypothetical protein
LGRAEKRKKRQVGLGGLERGLVCLFFFNSFSFISFFTLLLKTYSRIFMFDVILAQSIFEPNIYTST